MKLAFLDAFLLVCCIQSIYLISRPNGMAKLYEFVVVFGAFMLILAQIPSFHSLRHINLVSLILCLAYSAATTAGSIYAGWLLPDRLLALTRKQLIICFLSVKRIKACSHIAYILIRENLSQDTQPVHHRRTTRFQVIAKTESLAHSVLSPSSQPPMGTGSSQKYR